MNTEMAKASIVVAIAANRKRARPQRPLTPTALDPKPLGVPKGTKKKRDQKLQRPAGQRTTGGRQRSASATPPVHHTARAQVGVRRRTDVSDPVSTPQRAYWRRLEARRLEQAAAWRLERATAPPRPARTRPPTAADRAVLRLRRQGWTLARIGGALGISRQRVHQIEWRARSRER